MNRLLRRLARLIVSAVFGALLVCAGTAAAEGTVDVGLNGDGIGLSLALSTGGRPSLSFFNQYSGALIYSAFYNDAWHRETVDQRAGVPGKSALVFTGSEPHIIYSRAGAVLHAYRVNGVWTSEAVDSGAAPAAAACGTEICISYYDAVRHDLKFAKGHAGAWLTEYADASASDSGSASAITTAAGIPAIAYFDATLKQLAVARRTGEGVWVREFVSHPSEPVGGSPGIAAGPDGSLAVSTSVFKADVPPRELGVYAARRSADGIWSAALLPPAYAGGETSISLDSAQVPHVAGLYRRTSLYHGDATAVTVLSLEPSGAWFERTFTAEAGAEGAPHRYEGVQLAADPDLGNIVAFRAINAATNASTVRIAFTGAVGGVIPDPVPRSGPEGTDSDGDGLTDAQEELYGTDPHNPDTDSDEVADTQELFDGSDPRDAGSFLQAPGAEACASWSKISGEAVNVLSGISFAGGVVSISVYSAAGAPIAAAACEGTRRCEKKIETLIAKSKVKSGVVCASLDESALRVERFKEKKRGFDLAAASALIPGRKGSLTLSYSYKKLSVQEKALQRDVLVNIVNVENAPAAGILSVFSEDGVLRRSFALNLNPKGKAALSARSMKLPEAGSIQWTSASRCTVTAERAAAEIRGKKRTYLTSIELSGRPATGAPLIVPVDTRSGRTILEITNALNEAVSAEIRIVSADGREVLALPEALSGHAMRSFALDQIVGRGFSGSVKLSADRPGALTADVLRYQDVSGKPVIPWTSIAAAEPLGAVLRATIGSDGKASRKLLLLNPTSQSQTVSLSILSRGVAVPLGELAVGAGKSLSVAIPAADGVSAQPLRPGSVGAWLQEERAKQYSIWTHLQ